MFAAEIFVGNLKIEVTALMLLKLLNYNLPSLKNKMQHMMMQAERGRASLRYMYCSRYIDMVKQPAAQ